MPDASRPFRPREGVSRDPVREQIGHVQRRANGYTAQNTLYLLASFTLLAVAEVVWLALRLPRTSFAVAVWSTTAALLASGFWLVWRARREWIWREGAALRIDRRAALEDRLATLIAAPSQSSRLWPLLREQNLHLLPRWRPAEMVPRAVPRSAWLLAVAALLAIVVLRWTAPWGGGGGAGAGFSDRPGASDSAGGQETNPGSFLTALPDRLREAILGTEGTPVKGAVAAGRAGAAAGDGRESAGDGAPQSGQQSLTDTFPPEMAPPAGDSETGGSSSSRSARSTSKDGEPRKGRGGTEEAVRGDATKRLQRVEHGKPRPDRDKSGARGPGGRGAGAGTTGGGSALYGERDGASGAAGSFDLDLTGRGAAGGTGEDDPSPRHEASLAAEQRLDDAIRRAQVPPEYEQIIQRFFGREHPASARGETPGGAR